MFCLKDLFLLFIRQHELRNNAYLRIAVISASAGTLLEKQRFSNTEICLRILKTDYL